MNKIRISVVIPSYNRAHLLPRAIDSVLSQELQPEEVIVVDDGSTDDTNTLVERYPQIRYIYQCNSGAAIARNHGVQEAKGEWIAFLDSDDFWNPGYLKAAAAAIAGSHARAGLYFANTILPKGRVGVHLWSLADFSLEGQYCLISDAKRLVMSTLPLPMMLQSSIFHRDIYISSGGLWPALTTREDTHIFFRFGLTQVLCAVNAIGSQMTDDGGVSNRLTRDHNKNSRKSFLMQALMYEDLLVRSPELESGYRQTFSLRLASAYMRLAGIALRERKWLESIQFAFKSVRVDSRAMKKSIQVRLYRR